MSNRKVHFILLLAVITLSILSLSFTVPCYAASSEEFHQTYPLSAGAQFTLSNKNGNVTIEGWDRDYAEINAIKRTRKKTSELKKVTIDVLVNKDLKIVTRYSGRPRDVSVTYDIRIPFSVKVKEVTTTNGMVEVIGISGEGQLSSTNGAIRLKRSSGNFSLETTNGSIKVKGLDGNAGSYTTNGSIEIEDTAGIMDVKTTNGGVSLEIRSIPERSLGIQTTNGTIEVYIDPSLNIDLNAETSTGQINIRGLEIMVEDVSEGSLKGKLGKGGKMIRMRTSNGNIWIRKLD